MIRKSILGAGLILTIVACGEENDSGMMTDDSLVPIAVQNIFTANCAKSGCHAGSSPQQGMNLSESKAYGSIVNVTSKEKSTLKRVLPGNPDNSYLVQKIQGDAGITGDRMPKDQGAEGPNGYLTQAQIDSIRSWITNGALPR